MIKHTRKRRACAQRPFPIGITSLLREVANRLYVTAPRVPFGTVYPTMRAAFCQFVFPIAALTGRLRLSKKSEPDFSDSLQKCRYFCAA